MASDSVHNKLGRVRPPRVHVTYDVEVGGAIENKELPFVMGVLGDFSGEPAEPLKRLKDREFVDVTPDNFDQVLAGMKPRLTFSVDNKLTDSADAGKLNLQLEFEKLEDFSPEQVAKHVEPLNKLLELRTKLSDLKASLQGNDKLDELLQKAAEKTDVRNQLKNDLAGDDGKGESQ